MGKWLPVFFSLSRTVRIAAKPSISGICKSISTASTFSRSRTSSASRPFSATTIVWPCFSSSRMARVRLTALSSATRIFNPFRPSSAGRWTAGRDLRVSPFFASAFKSASRGFRRPDRFCQSAAIPVWRQRAASSPRAPELSMRTGIELNSGVLRIFSASVNPSISGIFKSVITTLNWRLAILGVGVIAWRFASLDGLRAHTQCASISARMKRFVLLSSTTRTDEWASAAGSRIRSESPSPPAIPKRILKWNVLPAPSFALQPRCLLHQAHQPGS